jgi:TolB-like protein
MKVDTQATRGDKRRQKPTLACFGDEIMGSTGRALDDKGERLDSWKAIAAYVGRDVRSAQRWERERGLPVHRVPGEKGGSVFAYTAELDSWLHNPRIEVSPSEVIGARVAEAQVAEKEQNTLPLRSGSQRPAWLTIAAIACLALLAAAYLWFRPARPPARPHGGRVMLAVLPFANLSGDPSQEYFADGLTEEMITDLGRLNPQALGVIARTSAMTYKQTQKSIGQIGRDLGVGYVLEGSVRRAGDTVRISAQLIQVSDQTHIWAQNYERQVKDILSVQRDVAQSIAVKIRISLEGQPGAVIGPAQAANPEAYDDYLKGVYFLNRREAHGLEESIKYFNQAIQEDPNYAPAYAALAQSDTLEGLSNTSLYLPKAEASARRAIALDDSAAEGHTALAGIRVFYYYDWQGAEAEFKRALDVNPNYATAHHWYANLYLDPQGRFLEALAEMKLAQQLDPTNLIVNADLGQAYYFARQYQTAVETCKKTMDMDPSFLPPQWYLADAYHQLGMLDEEVRLVAHFSSLEYAASPDAGRDGDWGEVLTDAYRSGGYQAFLQALLKQLRPNLEDKSGPPERLATTYLQLGQTGKAMDALEKSYAQHAPNIIYLRADPYYDPLRSEPRFQALERKMGLPTP